MRISIKTDFITLEVNDTPKQTGNGFTNHAVPDLIPAIKAAIEQAVILHNAVKNEVKP